MHGRLKVKTTEEQQESKRKEREKKLLLYRKVTNEIFTKRQKNELDQEMLNLTGELLSTNPDFYTLWNIRRELFQLWMDTKTSEELTKAFNAELSFLEHCLRINPKSYGTWHQRTWIMDRMEEPNWKRELMLCSRFLEIDERNFHCWDYRRLLVHRFGVLPETELEFTMTKISSNFSNFSSWHYRSKLLPVVFPDPSQPTGVMENKVQEEFEFVQNAFFTDPNDQSAWFYHKWLLGNERRELAIQFIHVDRKESKIIVILTQEAKIGADFNLSLAIDDGKVVDMEWSSVVGQVSILWMTHMEEKVWPAGKNHSIKLSLNKSSGKESNEEVLLYLDSQAEYCSWKRNYLPGTLFTHELSVATSDILSQEIESCRQLHELEPDNKWVILTLLSLMRALEPARYFSETVFYLDKLIILDPMRTNYYSDLRSKYMMEEALEKHPSSDRSFHLSGHQLSTVYHLDHLVGMTRVDFSQNSLKQFKRGHLLQCVNELKLNDNLLISCDGIEHLSCLEVLDIRNNGIRTASDLKALKSCCKLKRLLLAGNPVVNVPGCQEVILQMLSSVECQFT